MKDFVPYNEALELKELGFDEPCFGVFPDGSKLVKINGEPRNWNDNVINGETTSAPTFSQAFRWFREKCDLIGVILPYLIIGNQWYYKITNRNNSSGLPFEEGFETFEEAELACLNKLIEIVKDEKKNS